MKITLFRVERYKYTGKYNAETLEPEVYTDAGVMTVSEADRRVAYVWRNVFLPVMFYIAAVFITAAIIL